MFTIVDFEDFVIKNSEDPLCIDSKTPDDLISHPHSNSYVDLNGDCMPDIFLNKERILDSGKIEVYYEIYL